MAAIDVGGGHGGRRAANHDLPLIPLIDFLMCLIAFLLVTAVWSHMARIDASARVPGPPGDSAHPRPGRQLHVEVRDARFRLSWQQGDTVIHTMEVERKGVPSGQGGDVTYPALARRILEEWQSNGRHRAASDTKFDQAVLRTENSAPFADMVAVMDAIQSPKRDFAVAGKIEMVPAFVLSFAVD